MEIHKNAAKKKSQRLHQNKKAIEKIYEWEMCASLSNKLIKSIAEMTNVDVILCSRDETRRL